MLRLKTIQILKQKLFSQGPGQVTDLRSIVKALPSLLNSENGYLYLFVYDFWKYVSKCRLEFIYRKRTPSTFNSQSGEPPCHVTSPTLRLFLAH